MRGAAALGAAFAALLLLLVPGSLAGQACNTGFRDNFQSVTVTPSSLTLSAPGIAQFNQGWSATGQYSVYLQPKNNNATRTWYLCVTGSGNLGTVGSYTKPLSDLQWSLDGVTWQSVTNSYQQIRSGTGTTTVTVLVRVLLRWADDAPATYATAAGTPLTFQAAH